jgi:TatD DNase family protein
LLSSYIGLGNKRNFFMIDVHTHIQFQAFESDYEMVADRAFAAGVTKIINVGTKLDSSKKAVEFAEKYEKMYAIVGVHPHHADKPEIGWEKTLERLAQHKKVLAIGEVGMDYFSYKSNGVVDPKLQKDVFEKQIAIAHKLDLPLQIHQRQASNDLMEILHYHKNSLRAIPGMFHCFAGSMQFLKDALELGFYIGFDGNVTYKGLAPGETVALRDQALYVPLERLVVESDAPYLTPVPHRGERNEPAYVIITGRFLSELKQIPFETFIDQTTRNVYTIFTKLV